MNDSSIAELLWPILRDIQQRAQVTEHFLDKDIYRINIATIWVNLVLSPEDLGLGQGDLEEVHDFINREIVAQIGTIENLKSCFEFLNTARGEKAMESLKLNKQHKEMLIYFTSMILDPEGHERWMKQIKNKLDDPGKSI